MAKVSRADGESFLAGVEQVPVPTLTPGDIVIIDNLGRHKGKAACRAIRSAGSLYRHAGLPSISSPSDAGTGSESFRNKR